MDGERNEGWKEEKLYGETLYHGQSKVMVALHFIILTLNLHIINYIKRQKYEPVRSW